jgi:hypothetical protein
LDAPVDIEKILAPPEIVQRQTVARLVSLGS